MVDIHKLHFVQPAAKNSLVETGFTLYSQKTLIIQSWLHFRQLKNKIERNKKWIYTKAMTL